MSSTPAEIMRRIKSYLRATVSLFRIFLQNATDFFQGVFAARDDFHAADLDQEFADGLFEFWLVQLGQPLFFGAFGGRQLGGHGASFAPAVSRLAQIRFGGNGLLLPFN